MTILGIETATSVCAAAVVRDDILLVEEALREKHVHSEKLLTIIDLVLRKNGGYDLIAISAGPGSFTGLRIGLSVAKGLAFASGKSLIAVPTLEALAWRAVQEGFAKKGDEIVALIDARRRDVYAASYQVTDGRVSLTWGAQGLQLNELNQKLLCTRRTVFMGDGAEKFRTSLKEIHEPYWYFPPIDRRLCSASAVASVGLHRVKNAEIADLASLEPLYVKDFAVLVNTQHRS